MLVMTTDSSAEWVKRRTQCMTNNFNALVAIIAGLNRELIERARVQVHTLRVRTWEARMLHDLTDWTARAGDFEHIRHWTINAHQ